MSFYGVMARGRILAEETMQIIRAEGGGVDELHNPFRSIIRKH